MDADPEGSRPSPSGPRPGSRARRVGRTVALVVLLVVVVVAVTPWLRAHVKAVPTLADAVGVAEVRPLAPDIEVSDTAIGGVHGRLYGARAGAPGVLLVGGAAPDGLDDDRMVRAAVALSRAGRSVFAPELALFDLTLDEADITRIAEAAAGLAARSGGPVVVLGFSYGGSMALLAAVEEVTQGSIDRVAVFGAYGDLVGVVQAATTGGVLLDGVHHPWDSGRDLSRIITEFIEATAPEQAPAVTAVLDGQRGQGSLDDDERAVWELVTHRDPARTRALVEQLPDDVAERLRRFSPVSVADRIDVPVLAMHAPGDEAVPYAEGLRLQRELPTARLLTVELFEHVDFAEDNPGELLAELPDVARTVRFTGWVLVPGEGLAPASIRRWLAVAVGRPMLPTR